MLGNSHNFEHMVFVYFCQQKQLDKLEADFFQNKYIQILVVISQQFLKKFGELPFTLGSESTDQLDKLIDGNKTINKLVMNVNEDLPDYENRKNFLINAKATIGTNTSNYSMEYLKESCEAWLFWQSSQAGYREAIEFQRTQEITPENVLGIIRKAKEIVVRRSSVVLDDDIGEDFYDPNSHKQPTPKDLVNTGYPLLNKWMTDVEGPGGAEPGTLTIFVGESNIGKSIILGNLAQQMSANGYNVFLPSLEMATWKLFKRIGSNAFDVPLSEYSSFSLQPERVEEAIKHFKKNCGTELVPVGFLKSKRYSMATPEDIRNTALRIEDKTGEKVHAIVSDYMTEMSSSSGISWHDKGYYLHKMNANDLHRHSVDHQWAHITAHQLKITGYGADDVTLQMLGESSGIIHKPDNIYGIIQPPQMKLENKFLFKNLKGRDSAFKNYYIQYGIDYTKMRITEQQQLEPNALMHISTTSSK